MAARNAALEEQTRRQAEEQRAELDAVKAANAQLQGQGGFTPRRAITRTLSIICMLRLIS